MRQTVSIIILVCSIINTAPGLSNRCQCMDFGECKRSGGELSGYCDLAQSKVCCRQRKQLRRSLQTNCGIKGGDGDGEQVGVAEPEEWRWHAAILEKANHIYICGGSLIDELWVLTAAHCVDKVVPIEGFWPINVRLGEYDVYSNSEKHRHVEHDIADVIVHPQYNRTALVADLALLRLRFPVETKPNIGMVCVPREGISFQGNAGCFVTGWGRTREAGRHSKVLKEIEVPLWPRTKCENVLRENFGRNYSLPDGLMCAGAEGRDACEGDGGGPLVCEDAGQWYQVGIVSFGLSCGEKDMPGVYTNIEAYTGWIQPFVYGDVIDTK